MKLRIEKPPKVMIKTTGGGKKPLTYEQINQWSDYVEANPNTDFDILWGGFSSKNPKSGIDKEILKADLAKLVAANRALGEQHGHALSKSLNTGYSFPKMKVDGKDYGRVNADMKAQFSAPPVNANIPRAKIIPQDAIEIWQDPKDREIKFIDPKSGDVVIADQTALNDPRVKKSIAQQQKDMQARNIMLNNATSSILNVR